MKKRFKIVILCLGISVMLTGCYIPIIDKVITIPWLEKKPEEAMNLMYSKMTEVNSFGYNSKIEISMHVDPMELSLNFDDIRNNLLSFSDQPVVLGESNIPSDDTQKSLALSTAPPTMGQDMMGLPDFKSGPVDMTLFYNIKGKMDQIDPKNIKQESTVDMSLDLGGMILEFDVETKTKDKVTYIKIGQLPFPLSMMLGGEFSDKWWKIDIEDIQKEQTKLLEEPGIKDNLMSNEEIPELMDPEKQMEKTQELKREIIKLAKESNLIQIDERLRDEKVNGIKCYRYKISLNKAGFTSLMEGLFNILNREFNKVNPTIIEGFDKDKKFQEAISKIAKIITKAEGEVYIGKKDFYLYRTLFNFDLDLSKLELDGEKLPVGFIMSMNAEMNYKDLNKPVDIEIPEDTVSLTEYLDERLGDAQVKARDARRVSDIKQMQTACELYYNDVGKYPDYLTPGGTIEAEYKYMPVVPSNPMPSENLCSDDFEYTYEMRDNGRSYVLIYCLEGKTGYMEPGINVATPAGLAEDANIEGVKINTKQDTTIIQRDTQRISDIKRIQTALELYYNDFGKYPDEVIPGGEIEGNGQAYMFMVPKNPKPGSGICAEDFEYSYEAKNEGQDYEFQYCLEKGSGSINAGINIASRSGITGGNIEQRQTSILTEDSDRDGLINEEEINFYKTDPNVKDTDGDGYSDGEEVNNGYNPLGEGKLEIK